MLLGRWRSDLYCPEIIYIVILVNVPIRLGWGGYSKTNADLEQEDFSFHQFG
jgi:hypothetical protein